MANVRLGTDIYRKVAVVRMNTPDGSIVDFYESNYYDINLYGLEEDIISQTDAHSEYNITNFIDREALITILEQRFIPRLVITRQTGDSELVCLDRITITNTQVNEQIYIAEGEYGLPKNQIHFRVSYDDNNTYLDCYRAQSDTWDGEKPIKMDLSGFETEGKIRLIYADDGIMDINVTFNNQGKPIKFSNGEDVFELVWPVTEVADNGA